MPLQQTSGNVTQDAYGGGASAPAPLYVENVFSTYLYSGTGSNQAIPNGIPLASTSTWNTIQYGINFPYGQTYFSTTDSSGNIYVCGQTSPDSSNFYAFIAKFNSSNVLQWQNFLISSTVGIFSGICLDSSGNSYVAGYASDGTNNFGIIAKYNSSGTIQWQRKLTYSSGCTYNNIAIDSSNNLYVAGQGYDGTNYYGIIAKYNSSGSLQWQRKIVEEGNAQFNGIAVDSSNNVYVTGGAVNSGNNYTLTVKYNSSGSLQWARKYTNVNASRATGLVLDSSSNVYIATFGGSSNNVVYLQYNSSGTLQWQYILSNTGPYGNLCLDSSNNIYITGAQSNGGKFILKTNSSGVISWALNAYTFESNVSVQFLSTDTSGNLYVNGTGGIGLNDIAVTAIIKQDGSISNGGYSLVLSSNNTIASSSTSGTDSSSSATDSAGSGTDAASTATTSSGTALYSIYNQPAVSTTGGMVWIKDRSATNSNVVFDTVRGATKYLVTNSTVGQTTDAATLTSFTADGFNLGTDTTNLVNGSDNYASWTFRKAPNFFDIVTYTGTGSVQNIAHNLGSTPGCMIIKKTSSTGTWIIYFADNGSGWGGNSYYLGLNLTAAATSTGYPGVWGATDPTSTQFTVGTDTNVNASGQTYIAYLFGNGGTGGFGLSGTQDIIKCGYYTGNGSTSGPSITLGFEPQWVLTKAASRTGAWAISDVMRQMSQTNDAVLNPNTTGAEAVLGAPLIIPSATGFKVSSTDQNYNNSGDTYMYIAIRRGPMAIPTSGNSVFTPVVDFLYGSSAAITTGFTEDLLIQNENNAAKTGNIFDWDRLRGSSSAKGVYLLTNSASAETSQSTYAIGFDINAGIFDNFMGSNFGINDNVTYWNFARAPGFFDIVCYIGTGSVTTINHNLNAVPELMIGKRRGGNAGWGVYSAPTGNANRLVLNINAAVASDTNLLNSTNPTSTIVTLGNSAYLNAFSQTQVLYLFASLSGVSKVGSYTGNGTGQSIACGFGANGARFILIKRTDSTGDWYCFDSANGLTSTSSPYTKWNAGGAQTTGNNGTYASSGGFTLGSTASTTTNISSASYIFLAIA